MRTVPIRGEPYGTNIGTFRKLVGTTVGTFLGSIREQRVPGKRASKAVGVLGPCALGQERQISLVE
jgi:hypothetical protein